MRALANAETTTVIGASARPYATGLRDFWKNRHLVYLFVWRDLRARYKQTMLGAAWAILQPLLTVVVFTFVFRRLAKLPSEGLPYPVFVLCGLIPWQLVSQGVARAGNSLVNERVLLTRAYVPRLVIPVAAVLSGLADFAVTLAAAFVVLFFYGISPRITVIFLLPFLLLALATALCLGLFLSALNARYRDVSYLIPFFIQLWFFLTPIVYPSSLVPPSVRFCYFLNPMAAVVEGFRWSLTDGHYALANANSAPVMLVCLSIVLALIHFQRMDRSFADIV